MKALSAFVTAIVLLIASPLREAAGANAAELGAVHRYTFWRVWPQDCFLTPDVIVALDVLGPYCSSPRGHYYRHRIDRRW
jgi:hypothetical protein